MEYSEVMNDDRSPECLFNNSCFILKYPRNQLHTIDKTLSFFPVSTWSILFLGLGVNGHSKLRSMGMGYDTSSVMSSELETTSFLESDDDASSRITTTTGRGTNLLLGTFE